MTKPLSEIACEEFSEERASGSSVRNAIRRVADRHGRSYNNIRLILAREGTDLPTESNLLALALTVIGAAVVIVLVYWILSPSGRPSETELAVSDYSRLCTGGKRFDTTCKDKFIIWDGTVSSVGDGYVRTRLTDNLTVDLRGVDTKAQTLVDGQRIQISGWLAAENFVYPDVSSGQIKMLETADQADFRRRGENAQAAVDADKRNAAERVSDAYGSGRMRGMTDTLKDCQRFASNQAAYGACLAESRRGRGW